jgi:hypothetical protein
MNGFTLEKYKEMSEFNKRCAGKDRVCGGIIR